MSLRDQLPFTHPMQAVQTAYGALSAVQHEAPAVQVAASAVLLRAIADELQLDLSELLSMAARIIHDDDTPYRHEVAAFRSYVRGELKR